MARETVRFLFLTVLLVTSGCVGSIANRQLLSITVSPASATGTNPPFTATGNFNTAPYTVTPLPVSWFIMGPGIDPPPFVYSLTSANLAGYVLPCPTTPTSYTVIALAPAAPNAATSGPVSSQAFEDLVLGRTKSAEDGFVAGTAQLTCP